MEFTATDIANMKLMEGDGSVTLNEIVKDFIDDDKNSKLKEEMKKGVDYYQNNNDIYDKQRTYYEKGREKVDPTAANNKLPHAWHQLLVRQKMGYMVGKPMTFSAKDEEAEDFEEEVNDILGEKWSDIVNQLVKGCSNKGVEWLHPYIDSNGNFSYTVIDARESIPIWKSNRKENLEAFIRYYTIEFNGEKRIKAEYWTAESVTYFIENKNGNFQLDHITESPENNPRGHFSRVRREGNRVLKKEEEGWGQVPFIPFKNNEEMINDLNNYKELIDEYDENRSELADDLEELQEAIWVLKNYAGENLDEFQHNLRFYKAINVDGDGGAETVTVDIPTEAKKMHTEQLTDDIYKFGMGVKIDTDKFGHNPSGVALKFLYSFLDLKCDSLERKFKRAIRKLLEFIALYFKITEGIEYDHKSIKITFNKSMISNEAELVEMAQKSKGVISDKTVVENHPWVDDPAKEMDRMEEEKENSVDLDNV